MAAVTEREEKTVEVIKDIMPSLGDFDRGYLLGFGQGAQTMRDKAAGKAADDHMAKAEVKWMTRKYYIDTDHRRPFEDHCASKTMALTYIKQLKQI